MLAGRLRIPLNFAAHVQKFRCLVGGIGNNLQKQERNKDLQKDALAHEDFFLVSKLFNVEDLLNAKVHLGHHEGCWNPYMKPYIYGSRERFHIINLDVTSKHLKLALNVISHVAYRHGVILFVSTHPQFEDLVQETARDSGEFFVTRQWNIGTLTNSNVLLNTTRLPDLIIFMNMTLFGRGSPPIKEAAQCNIPSVGIVDSDCDPRLITYPIPGNDDSPLAMKLYCTLFKQAILNAKDMLHSVNADA
ncbi:28S ribosomal protein S2, mitochondrial-like [Xenia sp. Carnegie-2017]|uniref:28S ribosomal protein S2, mitochondrial-like n=1 Tax=Xenia sp. Carnegie-2017 TaxID=2897299 RepID=UPI001F048B9D|nr:28S ribosomal protein S2, mitochondrial-like [Xenia sp. Carnegie-2017]